MEDGNLEWEYNFTDYRMIDLGDWFSLPRTIRCGLHSGFPICCVAHFAAEEILFRICAPFKWSRKHALNVWIKNREQTKTLHVGYVPCPQCVKRKHFVVVKDCNCGGSK